MRLLLVEDEDALADLLEAKLRGSLARVDRLDRAIGRSDSHELIARNTYDAVLIDLRIPSGPKQSDASPEFGRAVEADVVLLQPGALRCFLTAISANEVVDQLSAGEVDHYFIAGENYQVVRYFQKKREEVERCMSLLARHEEQLKRLDTVPLERASALDADRRRAVAIGVSVIGGVSGRLVHPGGLSGCTTALLECFDPSDQLVGRCFLKVGGAEDIAAEIAGFEAIRFIWPTSALPNLACRLSFGIGRNHAVLFSQAPGAECLFELARRDPRLAVDYIRSLKDIVASHRSPRIVRRVIRELRRAAIDDRQFEPYLGALGVDSVQVEALTVDLLEFVQHGDMHGANLLVQPSGEPFVVDFGHTGLQVGPLDPVILELSLLFHPASGGQDRVQAEACRAWMTEAYAGGSSMSVVGSACRQLARDLGHDDRAVAAVAWVQSLRQLKYPDVSKEHALAIARSCGDYLLSRRG